MTRFVRASRFSCAAAVSFIALMGSASAQSAPANEAQQFASAQCAADDIDCRVEEAKARMLGRPAGLRPNEKRTAQNDDAIGPYAPGDVRRKPVRKAASPAGDPRKERARAKKRKSKSVYDSFGHAVYIRGGALLSGHVTNGDLDALGFTTSIGYRKRVAGAGGRSTWWLQPEIVYFRDRSVEEVVSVPVATTFSGIAGLVSLRWAYDAGFMIPFASVGVGPTRLKTVVDDGFSVTRVGSYAVGYSGVAGFETAISDVLSIETAYRYIGTVRTEASGFHTAEIGVNYKF